MPAPINRPLAHATQAYWWSSLQGLQGAHNTTIAETCAHSLHMIRRAQINERLTSAAEYSLRLIAKRRAEHRGAVGLTRVVLL
jgi:hypothetical protein